MNRYLVPGAILGSQNLWLAQQTFADDILLRFGNDGDIVLLNRSTALAADAELTGVIEGTSDHQGVAANSLILSNITNDGDIIMLVSDGGNSLEFLLANADVADLQIGHGMATVTVKTASGDLTLAPAGDIVLSPSGISSNYTLTDLSGALVFHNASSATDFQLYLTTQDEDGTDNVTLQIFGVGGRTSIANHERMIVGYTPSTGPYFIGVTASGTGTVRNFEIQEAGTAWLTKTASGVITFASGNVIHTTRTEMDKGGDVASTDEMTLGGDGNYFDITGTTTINHITNTGWQAGALVMLQFDASVTVTHNSGTPTGAEASLLLAGAGDFSATAGDTLTLVYDGTTFRELARTVI